MEHAEMLEHVRSCGAAFENDYNDEANGKFGFVIREASHLGSCHELVATFERALDEGEPRQGNGDYAKPVTRRWALVPVHGIDDDLAAQ